MIILANLFKKKNNKLLKANHRHSQVSQSVYGGSLSILPCGTCGEGGPICTLGTDAAPRSVWHRFLEELVVSKAMCQVLRHFLLLLTKVLCPKGHKQPMVVLDSGPGLPDPNHFSADPVEPSNPSGRADPCCLFSISNPDPISQLTLL